MIEFLTSRSRRQNLLRCPRAGYWRDEAFGMGFSPVKLAVPLVTGGSVHKGLARLLLLAQDGLTGIDDAVADAVADYESKCTGREFDLEALESQSYVFNEQRALTEALVRVAGLRIIPKILEQYEVLEVERMDGAPLLQPDGDEFEYSVRFRSIPDALLRARADGNLYVLSWKTCAEYDPGKDADARVDMQGLSEPWALEQRLLEWRSCPEDDLPRWFIDHINEGGSAEIRGVQMVYLVKGPRRKMAKEQMAAEGLSAEQIAAGGAMYKTASPLIYGYKKDPAPGLTPLELAWASEWKCSQPHPMRKSKWYPTGECPGDGRNHKRDDEWKSFPVWSANGGVKAWVEMLDAGLVTPEAGDVLNASWAMPVPYYRTRESVESWLRQTRAGERRKAQDLLFLRQYEQEYVESKDPEVFDALMARLDESFQQNTEKCRDWFHRRCPAWELCHGPAHVRMDPLGSGLFRIKEQYQPVEVGE